MKNLTSFSKQFVAFMAGDTDKALAEKVWRTSQAAINAAYHVKKGQAVALETKLETAKEEVNTALMNNGKVITDNDNYIKGIILAENKVVDVTAEVEDLDKLVAYLKEKISDSSSS
jgi:hydroxymethylpyrimidine pyrophosphatase-like HAD family hydrolase|tara:strand:+ start:1198 stop:1545 length:348 start_codon:yes stop_codon:yes gene_type:complete